MKRPSIALGELDDYIRQIVNAIRENPRPKAGA